MKRNKDFTVFRFEVILDQGRGKRLKDKPRSVILIKATQSLSTLARTIVKSFGFHFDHCYGFYDNFKDPLLSQEMYELFTDLGEKPTPGAQGVERVKIRKAFPEVGKKLRFLFDYGDNWLFEVRHEYSWNETKSKIKYPVILRTLGKAPKQYPPIDEDVEEGELKDQDWFHEDCPLCQALKKSGGKMQWFPDEPVKKKTIN